MKLFVCITSFVMLSVPMNGLSAQQRGFSVKDDIEMVRFNDPSASQGDTHPSYSPDGKYFAVVTSRGVLDSDEIESTLSVFEVSAVRSYANGQVKTAPAPRVVARVRSFPHAPQGIPYAPVISDLEWAGNSRRLYFRGENILGNHQLYRVAVHRRSLVALTEPKSNVMHFSTGGNVVVYAATQHSTPSDNSPSTSITRINQDAIAATGSSISALLAPNRPPPTAGQQSLWVLATDSQHPRARPLARIDDQGSRYIPEVFSVSPNGRWLITLSPVRDVPPGWRFYEAAVGFEKLARPFGDPWTVSPKNLDRLKRYTLVDLIHGSMKPLINAPFGRAFGYGEFSRAVWSSDGTRVAVFNTFLPRGDKNPGGGSEAQKSCVIATVDLFDRRVDCVTVNADRAPWNPNGVRIQDVRFGVSKQDLFVNKNEALVPGIVKEEHYLNTGAQWKSVPSEPSGIDGSEHTCGRIRRGSGREGLQVSMRQDLNTPPALWTSDLKTGLLKKLWDPNPRLEHIELGDVSAFSWKDKDGHTWRGGLVKPVHFQAGKPYPLVIQIYDFNDQEFMTNGMDPTAFAARPLSSAGIMVLQVQRDPIHTFDMGEELLHVEALESAIASLSDLDLVDPTKVGVVGFSISCQYVESALIARPELFAAATIADGIDNSYMQYLLAGSTVRRENELYIGAKPFGDGLKSWIDKAPGFHLDRVRAPVRIESMGVTSLLSEWEIYSSLSAQLAPVDLIYFPAGQHIHQKPLERLASQQGDVDWFRFWLQDYEDPDPTKSNQYRRWEELRVMRDKKLIAIKGQGSKAD